MSVVSIHIGQAGVRIGDQFWEQLCKEHSISSWGHAELDNVISEKKKLFMNYISHMFINLIFNHIIFLKKQFIVDNNSTFTISFEFSFDVVNQQRFVFRANSRR